MARRASWTKFLSSTALALGIGLYAGAAQADAGPREALADCVPGQLFADCQAALAKAGVEHRVTPTQAPNHLWVPLSGSYLAIEIEATNGRISLVDFQSELATGPSRRELVTWLRRHLPHAHEIAAQGNRGCGASGGGPAWISLNDFDAKGKAAEPAVQLAIDTFSSLRAGAGKPLDTVFIETRAKPLHLCFLSPSAAAAAVMRELLLSPLLHRALPNKPQH